MGSSPKTLLGNLLLLLATLIVLILSLEWALRFTGIQRMESRRPHLHQRTTVPGVHYEFIPNLKNERGYNWERISTNSLGFRGPEMDPGKPTVVLIGDSFAFGFGVNDDETHAHLLGRRFPEYNILNTGVNGYNIEQEVRGYLAKFSDLQPKLVIVEFVWNDMKKESVMTEDAVPEVHDLEGLENKAITDTQLEKSIGKEGTIGIPFKLWLTRNSAIFTFIEKRTKWLPFRARKSDLLTETITPQDLAFYEEWLSKLTEQVKDAKRMFVIWPEPSLHLESRKALRAMAEARDFVVLDLYDLFGLRYPSLSWDWHPNAKAHGMAGEVMAEVIRKYQLLE